VRDGIENASDINRDNRHLDRDCYIEDMRDSKLAEMLELPRTPRVESPCPMKRALSAGTLSHVLLAAVFSSEIGLRSFGGQQSRLFSLSMIVIALT